MAQLSDLMCYCLRLQDYRTLYKTLPLGSGPNRRCAQQLLGSWHRHSPSSGPPQPPYQPEALQYETLKWWFVRGISLCIPWSRDSFFSGTCWNHVKLRVFYFLTRWLAWYFTNLGRWSGDSPHETRNCLSRWGCVTFAVMIGSSAFILCSTYYSGCQTNTASASREYP